MPSGTSFGGGSKKREGHHTFRLALGLYILREFVALPLGFARCSCRLARSNKVPAICSLVSTQVANVSFLPGNL